MICVAAACETSDAATRAKHAVVNLILYRDLYMSQETFLLNNNLIRFSMPADGGVRPITISETCHRFAGIDICALRAHG